MTVSSTPFLARLRFQMANEDAVQSYTRVSPTLTQSNVQTLISAINGIRIPIFAVAGGQYTIMDELESA